MTDHTPDVADLPAELEQLRELAAAVGSKYEVQPGVWLARHRLEAAARRWLDNNGNVGELKQAVRSAGFQRGNQEKDRLDRLAEFIEATEWATESGGVRRGEALGVGVAVERQRTPEPRSGADQQHTNDDKSSASDGQEMLEQGVLERLLVELRPTSTSGPPKVEPGFKVADDDGGLRASLTTGVAAGLGWVEAHDDWLDIPEVAGWQARVYVGGYPVPADVDSPWADGVKGPSLGLAVALATVAAFLPEWARRASRLDVTRVDAALWCVATGTCNRDNHPEVGAVGGIETKTSLAKQHPRLMFLIPAEQQLSVRLGDTTQDVAALPHQQISNLNHAIEYAFPRWGRLAPGERVDGWLAVLAGVSGRHGRDLVELLLPPRVKGDPDRLEARLAADEQWAMQLTGVGGAGKTSALTWLYVAAYRGHLTEHGLQPVPCYLNAAELELQAEQEGTLDRGGKLSAETLTQAIAKELFDPLPDDWSEQLKRLAADVGLLVLVDGLNEMDDPQRLIYEGGPLTRLWSLLNDARRDGAPSVVVAAGRPDPHGHRALGTDALRKAFTPVELAPLTENDAAGLLDKLAVADHNAKRALQTVGGTGGLAGTPMVVALLARLYQTGTTQPPDSIGELYRQVINVWLTDDLDSRKWSPPAGVRPRRPARLVERIREVLGQLAVAFLEQRHTTEDDLEFAILTTFQDKTWIHDDDTLEDAVQWFRNCPLLVWQPARKQFRFLHDSLTDYLAAHHLHTTAAPLDNHLKPGREGLLWFHAHLADSSTVAGTVQALVEAASRSGSGWHWLTTAGYCQQGSASLEAASKVRQGILDRVVAPLQPATVGPDAYESLDAYELSLVREGWIRSALRLVDPGAAASELLRRLGDLLPDIFDRALEAAERDANSQQKHAASRTEYFGWYYELPLEFLDRYLALVESLDRQVEWSDVEALAVASDPVLAVRAIRFLLDHPEVFDADSSIREVAATIRRASTTPPSADPWVSNCVDDAVDRLLDSVTLRLRRAWLITELNADPWARDLVDRIVEDHPPDDRPRASLAVLWLLHHRPHRVDGWPPELLAQALERLVPPPTPVPDHLRRGAVAWTQHKEPAVCALAALLLISEQPVDPEPATQRPEAETATESGLPELLASALLEIARDPSTPDPFEEATEYDYDPERMQRWVELNEIPFRVAARSDLQWDRLLAEGGPAGRDDPRSTHVQRLLDHPGYDNALQLDRREHNPRNAMSARLGTWHEDELVIRYWFQPEASEPRDTDSHTLRPGELDALDRLITQPDDCWYKRLDDFPAAVRDQNIYGETHTELTAALIGGLVGEAKEAKRQRPAWQLDERALLSSTLLEPACPRSWRFADTDDYKQPRPSDPPNDWLALAHGCLATMDARARGCLTDEQLDDELHTLLTPEQGLAQAASPGRRVLHEAISRVLRDETTVLDALEGSHGQPLREWLGKICAHTRPTGKSAGSASAALGGAFVELLPLLTPAEDGFWTSSWAASYRTSLLGTTSRPPPPLRDVKPTPGKRDLLGIVWDLHRVETDWSARILREIAQHPAADAVVRARALWKLTCRRDRAAADKLSDWLNSCPTPDAMGPAYEHRAAVRLRLGHLRGASPELAICALAVWPRTFERTRQHEDGVEIYRVDGAGIEENAACEVAARLAARLLAHHYGTDPVARDYLQTTLGPVVRDGGGLDAPFHQRARHVGAVALLDCGLDEPVLEFVRYCALSIGGMGTTDSDTRWLATYIARAPEELRRSCAQIFEDGLKHAAHGVSELQELLSVARS